MASILNKAVSDTDEDLITCHVCLQEFSSLEKHKPKFLDCHHYFCVSCIQGFSNVNSVLCPTCRRLTNMKGRKIEELATNNVVLRLVTIETNRARELAEREKKRKAEADTEAKQQKWCTDCSFLAYGGCIKDNHQVKNYKDYFQDRYSHLQSIIGDIQSSCKQALNDFKKIQLVHTDILGKLQVLYSEINRRVASSKDTIAELECRLKSVNDIDISEEEEMFNLIKKVNHLIVEFSGKLKETQSIKLNAGNLLRSYGNNLNEAIIMLSNDETMEDKKTSRTAAVLNKDIDSPSCSGSSHVKESSGPPNNKKIRISIIPNTRADALGLPSQGLSIQQLRSFILKKGESARNTRSPN
ncbi:E3 ubiquitin-protein ligase TRIM32-like [Daphnia pulicaria]|uniref:E3 ubiquitin-protein ligase TRIM32-like n=1 Tax=Daphnia pulicaria TaxID=35523 RepID=UPI001EECB0E7|nr:E3 ubiquitin-protein ligase TRIM32-like [Daphnia pulicaria]XP_046637048.1 E3 ubiquitin-protein ligase TRIM32-like [Daphnia pulicaria]XP_046637049.1 E3 ubiquitin-protein ligase TRIM32-like [Daphnia pulicaria]